METAPFPTPKLSVVFCQHEWVCVCMERKKEGTAQ